MTSKTEGITLGAVTQVETIRVKGLEQRLDRRAVGIVAAGALAGPRRLVDDGRGLPALPRKEIVVAAEAELPLILVQQAAGVGDMATFLLAPPDVRGGPTGARRHVFGGTLGPARMAGELAELATRGQRNTRDAAAVARFVLYHTLPIS